MDLKQVLSGSSLEAAPRLLGCYLSRQTPAGLIRVRIVETEAYHQDDPASHSFRGRTARTAPMFLAGGRLYVYLSYGLHHAINIVTGPAGRGEAVLIRAAEPIDGVEIMQNNRGIRDTYKLTNGPGKLAQALGVGDTSLSGKILNKSSILLEPGGLKNEEETAAAPRIGITKAAGRPWRFYIKGNPFVSRR